jgi:putative intracellular protease/amidase
VKEGQVPDRTSLAKESDHNEPTLLEERCPNASSAETASGRDGATCTLCLATNHGVLDIGVATGVFASELTVPYYVFLDAGMAVDVASPLGGIIPVDPLSMKDLIRTPDDDRLLGDLNFRKALMHSRAIADLDFAAYDIIYFAGGWGAAFDLGQSEALGRKVSDAHAAGRVIGGICHGPLGLLRGRTPSGELIVTGRRLTAVTSRSASWGSRSRRSIPKPRSGKPAPSSRARATRRVTSSPTTMWRTGISSPARTRTPDRWWPA